VDEAKWLVADELTGGEFQSRPPLVKADALPTGKMGREK
jgi:hypothetical protein